MRILNCSLLYQKSPGHDREPELRFSRARSHLDAQAHSTVQLGDDAGLKHLFAPREAKLRFGSNVRSGHVAPGVVSPKG